MQPASTTMITPMCGAGPRSCMGWKNSPPITASSAWKAGVQASTVISKPPPAMTAIQVSLGRAASPPGLAGPCRLRPSSVTVTLWWSQKLSWSRSRPVTAPPKSRTVTALISALMRPTYSCCTGNRVRITPKPTAGLMPGPRSRSMIATLVMFRALSALR